MADKPITADIADGKTSGGMDERELTAAIKNQIFTATGYLGGQITEDRRKAMRDYLGEPLGNEIEGRSQVISSDVQDVVESVMPDLVQIFTSSDKAVRFEPQGQEDEEIAEQATDYVNHIWNVDNPGFSIFHDWFKDALLQINGIIKIWWDDSEKTEKRKYTGLTDDQLTYLLDDDNVEVIEHSEYIEEDSEQEAQEMGIGEEDLAAIATLHDITIKRTIPAGRVRIMNIPPEEFLISRRARTLDDSPFTAHWVQRTVSELIEDGYDPEQIERLPSDDEQEFNEERVTRFNRDDEWPFQEQEVDKSMREIRTYECYIKMDYEGTGVASMHKVMVAGPGYEILRLANGDLDVEPVADHPFCAITPIKMPHKFFGRSLAELVQDIQYIKTSIWRQLLDNMYQINNGRAALSNKVSLDDYLDNKVGAPVRVNTDGPDAAGHIVPIQTASIGGDGYPLLEYADTVRETRTGISRLGQGVDPDALNSTASGINQLIGRGQQRTLLIAQVFAYTGVRDAFRKILKLVGAHQDKPRVIRLRNKWVEMDPRVWNSDMDVTVNVGLGRGTQENRIQAMNALLVQVKEVISFQGGMQGPLVKWHHFRAAMEEFAEAIGVRSLDPFMTDISEQESEQIQPPEPPPDPAAQKAAADMQLKQADSQLKAQESQAKQQMDAQSRQAEIEMREREFALKREEAEAKAQLDREAKEAELEQRRQERAIEFEFKEREARLKEQQWAAELAFKERMHALDLQTKEHDMAVKQTVAAASVEAKQKAAETGAGASPDK